MLTLALKLPVIIILSLKSLPQDSHKYLHDYMTVCSELLIDTCTSTCELVDTLSTTCIGQLSIECWSIVNPNVDQLSINQSSVNWVLIKMLTECQLRCWWCVNLGYWLPLCQPWMLIVHVINSFCYFVFSYMYNCKESSTSAAVCSSRVVSSEVIINSSN